MQRFGLMNTEGRLLVSKQTSTVYQIGIWFPFGYSAGDKRYPVLYLTDGDLTFGLATGLIPTLIGNGEIPEIIVVGIGYSGIDSYEEFGKLRDPELLPDGIAATKSRITEYTSMIRHELMPLIESDYRAIPENRGLLGFSNGGFFALHTMLKHPGLFSKYCASSCTWPGATKAILSYLDEYKSGANRPKASLYLAVGGLEKEHLAGFNAIRDLIEGADYPEIRLETEEIGGESHSSAMIASTFIHGLRKVYTKNGG